MTAVDLPRRLAAEALGTGLLVATVIGSGIMAARLAGEAGALALLCNTIPTGAILVVLVAILGPLSGAHLNPAVTLAFSVRGAFPWRRVPGYIIVQLAGANAESIVTFAWEITWYQYRISPEASQPVRIEDRGQDIDELSGTFAQWNARLDEGARLVPDLVRV